MRLMPDIKLTRDEYLNFIHNCKKDEGGESFICKGNRPDTLYKLYIDYIAYLPTYLSDNKYKKLLALYEKPLEHSVQPLSTISLNGELVGYEMTYDENDISLEKISLPRRHLIKCLKQTSEILKYYESHDITYGDVKSNNILINKKTHQAKFCDMDNIRLGEYPIDLINDYVDSIITSPDDIDASVDAYMHNLMTIQKLNDPQLTYDQILYNLSEGKYRRTYKKEAHEVLRAMASPEHFNGEYIAQYIKR